MTRKEIINNIIYFCGLIAFLTVLRMYVFSPVTVSGSSMNPTMVDHEKTFALKNVKINRFDVVTFPAPDKSGDKYIKRVIGLPGESVEFKDDQLYINGEKIDEPFLDDYKDNPTKKTMPYGLPLTKDFNLETILGVKTVPEGSIFVMGDNRQNSTDSRIIGFIKEEDVIANVKFVYWPPQKWGTFNQGMNESN